jgi:replicative DNA helicase
MNDKSLTEEQSQSDIETRWLQIYDDFLKTPEKDRTPEMVQEYDKAFKEYDDFLDGYGEALKDEPSLKEKHYEFLKNNQDYLYSYLKKIEAYSKRPVLATGFDKLDRLLDGGLYDGLYLLGAIPSIGKTAIALQIADNVSRQGIDVLFFSFEMSKFELTSRLISKIANESYLAKNGTLSTRQIMKNSFIRSEPHTKAFNQAYEDYFSNVSKHLWIKEINYFWDVNGKEYSYNISTLIGDIKQHIEITGRTPLVIIDYLQLIPSLDEKATDKQNIDRLTSMLKQTSREHEMAVLAISNFNRVSYKEKPTMASFKESGSIEYSADVLMSLFVSGTDTKDADGIQEALRSREKEVDMSVLKNRNGERGEVGFIFDGSKNLFKER